jgi:hypothetical protein
MSTSPARAERHGVPWLQLATVKIMKDFVLVSCDLEF